VSSFFDVNNGSQNSKGLSVSISCTLAVNTNHSSTYICTDRTLTNFINVNIVNPILQILLSSQIKRFTLCRTGSRAFGRYDMQFPNTFTLPWGYAEDCKL